MSQTGHTINRADEDISRYDDGTGVETGHGV
jgi:hypothetical protein